jgi:hypothetical protein
MAKRQPRQAEQPAMEEEEIALPEEAEELEATPEVEEGYEFEDQPEHQPPQTRGDDETSGEFRARLAAEKARADTYAQALQAMQQMQQQPQRIITQPQVEEDPFKDFSPEARTYIPLVTRIAEHIAQQKLNQQLGQLRQEMGGAVMSTQQSNVAVQEMVDDMKARRELEKYGDYEEDVQRFRDETYRMTGLRVPRRQAYFIVKGERDATQRINTRTTDARRKAKQSASVEAAAPVAKGAPATRSQLTMDQVAKMSLEEAEAWLKKNQTR